MYRHELSLVQLQRRERALPWVLLTALLVQLLVSGVPVAAAQPPESEWLIEAGVRVGPITVNTSDTQLASLFGAENIEAIAVQIGEGFTEPGTAIYPDDPERRIEVIWYDETRSSPASAWLRGESSKWRTTEGISLGTTLKEIERLNGYPFRLAGFGWDYGGTITDCGRGRLHMLRCTQAADNTSRMLMLRLSAPYRQGAYEQVHGDREFSSGHPAMQELNPAVRQMIVYFHPRIASDGNTGKPGRGFGQPE